MKRAWRAIRAEARYRKELLLAAIDLAWEAIKGPDKVWHADLVIG